jgi:hypothetical protein
MNLIITKNSNNKFFNKLKIKINGNDKTIKVFRSSSGDLSLFPVVLDGHALG